HGDLGKSITTRRPVIDEIAQRYPATLKLALGATVFAAVVGITFGVLSAVKQNKLTDNVIMVFSLLSVSTPSFFLALVMLLLFSIHLGWLPSMGLRTPLHYVLPIITLGMQSVGLIARTTRSSMLEVLRQDYIRTSRSRGISQAVIVMRHAFKNALIPVVTVVGLRFGGLLAGSMLVEAVFSVPGIGRFMVDGVLKRDYPVVQGTVLVLATTFVLVNLAVDLIYALIDPRIKYD
ncbi:ABC transporter permease, partial [Gordonibacter pamelaeae]